MLLRFLFLGEILLAEVRGVAAVGVLTVAGAVELEHSAAGEPSAAEVVDVAALAVPADAVVDGLTPDL